MRVATILLTSLVLLTQSIAASGDEPNTPEPLKGRVELIESGGAPTLPPELLKGYLENPSLGPTTLPKALKGRWYGVVRVTQMQTYPALHAEDYCLSFISEIKKVFHLNQKGQIVLEIGANANGAATLSSSDVVFARGLRVQLNSSAGPALVPGGTNVPQTVRNEVTEMDSNRVEQTRIDRVVIVDEKQKPIHFGFAESSALYRLSSPQRMKVKILTVDYDFFGKPLWKCMMEGEASR